MILLVYLAIKNLSSLPEGMYSRTDKRMKINVLVLFSQNRINDQQRRVQTKTTLFDKVILVLEPLTNHLDVVVQ